MNQLVFFILLGLPALRAQKSKDCLLKVDVVFVVDSSRSIWAPDYHRQLDFLANLTRELDVGPQGTHVAAASFSRGARLDFYLNDFTDVDVLEQKIRDIPFMQGDTTETYDGLRIAREQLLSPSNGARNDVPHLIIIVTDGNSVNRTATKLQADLAREDNIEVFAVGIGDSVDQDQLAEIATKNTPAYVHRVDNFSALKYLSNNLVSGACLATTTSAPTPPPPTTTPSSPGEVTTTAEQMINDQLERMCTSKKADVVFVLDKSSSITTPHFRKQLNFVSNVIGLFNVAKNHTHVSVVTFDTKTKVEFGLQDYETKSQVRQAVLKIKYTAGATNTHLALEKVAKEVLTPKGGARKDVARVIIVVTDGMSSDEENTKRWAGVLKKKFRAKIFAIGVGTDVDETELNNIGSHPAGTYVFHVIEGYEALASIKESLAMRACEVPSGDIFVRCQQNAIASDVMFVTHFARATLSDVSSSTELVKNVAAGFMTSQGKVRVGLTSSDCVQVSDVTLGQVSTAKDFADTVRVTKEGGMYDALQMARLQVTAAGGKERQRVIVVMVHGPISDLSKVARQVMRARFAGVKFVFVGRDRAVKAELKLLAKVRRGADDQVVMEGEGKSQGGQFWQVVLSSVCQELTPGQRLD
ncbi:matrilin-1-like [Babylonia areolata]|uniref:matrilin-1-like n=1 Tax=Babylonia areolata TaxID=304850 RepID=UPI003FD67C43